MESVSTIHIRILNQFMNIMNSMKTYFFYFYIFGLNIKSYLFSNVNKTFYELTGTLTYPATNKSYSFINGTLTNYKPLPDAQKTLAPQDFTIVWEAVIPAIIG